MSKDLGRLILSAIVAAGFLACMAILVAIKVEFSAGAEKVFLILAGALAQTFGQVTNWWFGSSAGSAEKGEQLAAIAAGKAAG